MTELLGGSDCDPTADQSCIPGSAAPVTVTMQCGPRNTGTTCGGAGPAGMDNGSTLNLRYRLRKAASAHSVSFQSRLAKPIP